MSMRPVASRVTLAVSIVVNWLHWIVPPLLAWIPAAFPHVYRVWGAMSHNGIGEKGGGWEDGMIG